MLEEEEGGAHVLFGSAAFPRGFEQVLFAGMPGVIAWGAMRCRHKEQKTSALTFAFPPLLLRRPGFDVFCFSEGLTVVITETAKKMSA